jgi:NAD(P)H-dependent flavin oxidoreductase YrpB (nitropropane dioxygenase family)
MDNPIISTRFTKEYGVKYPFASAGVGFFGMADLAIEVNKAGGIGAIGVAMLYPDQLRAQIREVKKATALPLNVNFITFLANDEHIWVCVEEEVAIVSFHWGHPSQTIIDLLKKANIKIWEQAGSVEDAKKAIGNGVDLIIAQGLEAGGHNYGVLPTFVLVPEIVDAVKPAMVLASGGIVTGKQVAAALCLGADGVWVGGRNEPMTGEATGGIIREMMAEAALTLSSVATL